MATRPETKDSNFSWEFFIEKVNSDLNDTFGNFVHRTLKFVNTQFNSEVPEPGALDDKAKQIQKILKEKIEAVAQEIEDCKLQSAANNMIGISRIGNQFLNETEPWNLLKTKKAEAGNIIYSAIQIVKALATVSAPFIPFTAEKLWKTLNLPGSVHEQKWDEALRPLPAKHKIAKAKPLFQKIEANEQKLNEKLEKIRDSLAKNA